MRLVAAFLLIHAAVQVMGQSCTDAYAPTAATLNVPVACMTVGVGESCIYTTATVGSQTRKMVGQSTVSVWRWGVESGPLHVVCMDG